MHEAWLQIRESRLRSAGIPNRARMASELRDMDNEVSALSRALAVRTLQLEMEFIYGCLEDEALDITQGISAAAFMLFRYNFAHPLPALPHFCYF